MKSYFFPFLRDWVLENTKWHLIRIFEIIIILVVPVSEVSTVKFRQRLSRNRAYIYISLYMYLYTCRYTVKVFIYTCLKRSFSFYQKSCNRLFPYPGFEACLYVSLPALEISSCL